MAFWSNKSSGFDQTRKGYVTNLEASNLVNLPKSIEDIKSEYDRTMAETKNIEQCTKEKPYSTGYTCKACSTDQPLFNLTSHRCTSCEEGETYNPSNRTCTSEDEQDATVDGSSKRSKKKRVKAVPTES